MADLVACINDPKLNFGQVRGLVNRGDWENIFLVTDSGSRQHFSAEKDVKFIEIDTAGKLKGLTEDIRKNLSGKLSFGDVAVNLVYGSGKEHMAVIGALLKLGCGIRLVALTMEGVTEV